MLSETFEQRLLWIDPNYFERGNESIVIRENTENGVLELGCTVRNDSLKFNLESKNRLSYLKHKKVADAVIFEIVEPDSVRIHIIECKTTVNSGSSKKSSSWEHVKLQFCGALQNALGVLGILGLSAIRDVKFYTAFINDRISPENNPNPVTLRTGFGENSQIPPLDWMSDKISVLSISSAHHRKIQLNAEGKGSVTL
ncbi:hypothetical protein QUF76_02900 [Desulfobacterales bacterium HSG16]|nr:hypothetical protein [Desulfobacterales bacterium HSG16]